MLGDILGGSDRDDLPAALSPFRAQVDDPVGGLDDIEIVLDDDHGVTVIAQAVLHPQQLLDVVEMQPRGGFVEDV